MITKFVEQLRANRRAKSGRRAVVECAVAAPKARSSLTKTRRSVSSRKRASTRASITKRRCSKRWIAIRGSTCRIERAITSVSNRLQDGLAFLGTVGSTAPFVGLFGTVWGIYHALTAIGIAGQASIDKVAGPVGEALIMTAIGLAVAVPAVLGYNLLVRRNKAVMERVRGFGAQLHTVLLPGTKRRVRAVANATLGTPQRSARSKPWP